MTAVAIERNESSSSVMSLASLATDVPEPIERPTLAKLSAGASFVPSPVTATTSPCCCNSRTSRCLSSGRARERIFSEPSAGEQLFVARGFDSTAVTVGSYDSVTSFGRLRSVPRPTSSVGSVRLRFGSGRVGPVRSGPGTRTDVTFRTGSERSAGTPVPEFAGTVPVTRYRDRGTRGNPLTPFRPGTRLTRGRG